MRVLLISFLAATAWSASVDGVKLARDGDTLVFEFACGAEVAADAVSTKRLSNGSVLEIHLAGLDAKRGWVKLKDKALKRTLLKSGGGAAILRTRLKDPLPEAAFEGIKVSSAGETVTVRVPTTEAAAKAAPAPVAAAVVAPVPVPAAPPPAPAAPEPKPEPVAKVAPPKQEKPAEEPAAPAAPESQIQDDGTVQTGILILTQRLATALEAQEATGFRRVAVLPFKPLDKDVTDHSLDKVSTELMSAKLAQRPRILQVERSRLDAVVSELKRSERGELSPKGAASVGKLLGANSVVLGSVGTAGADYIVTARAVDAETGQVLAAADPNFTRQGMIAISEEVVEVKSKFGAAVRSAVAPGWGQIYNGDTGRGIAYLTLFVGAAGGAITSAVLGVQAENEYQENSRDTVDRREDANAHYDRVNLFLIGLGAVWAVAVADAYITGTDAQVVDVGASADGQGAGLFLSGRF